VGAAVVVVGTVVVGADVEVLVLDVVVARDAVPGSVSSSRIARAANTPATTSTAATIAVRIQRRATRPVSRA
jgi:hypothetical protein